MTGRLINEEHKPCPENCLPRRAAGGHLVHAKRKSRYGALCGFKPSSPNAFRMVGRSRWHDTLPGTLITCNNCLERMAKLAAIDKKRIEEVAAMVREVKRSKRAIKARGRK